MGKKLNDLLAKAQDPDEKLAFLVAILPEAKKAAAIDFLKSLIEEQEQERVDLGDFSKEGDGGGLFMGKVPACVFLLQSLTPECREWIERNVDHQEPFTGSVPVESRFIEDILEGLEGEGFEEEVDFEIIR
ncbi:MAG: hypothetical protein R6X07_04815 [Desulfatiglandales bacterium]